MGVDTGLGETDLFDFVSVFFVLLILMFTDLGEGAGEYFFWTLPYFFISSNFGETPDVAVENSPSTLASYCVWENYLFSFASFST